MLTKTKLENYHRQNKAKKLLDDEYERELFRLQRDWDQIQENWKSDTKDLSK